MKERGKDNVQICCMDRIPIHRSTKFLSCDVLSHFSLSSVVIVTYTFRSTSVQHILPRVTCSSPLGSRCALLCLCTFFPVNRTIYPPVHDISSQAQCARCPIATTEVRIFSGMNDIGFVELVIRIMLPVREHIFPAFITSKVLTVPQSVSYSIHSYWLSIPREF